MKKTITINATTAYYSCPNGDKKHPGLILIEEVWGVNDHIKSVADRFAQKGYVVLAPELLPHGLLEMLTPQIQADLFDPEKRSAVQPRLREAMAPIMQPDYATGAIETLKQCVDYVLNDENGNVAVLGFCFGGTYSFHLAAHDNRIQAAVSFYGQPPSEEEIQNIQCPILAFYGDQDAHLMQSLPKLSEDMRKQQKTFDAIVYPNVGHAFFNDTNTHAYNLNAAQDAWSKSLDFLGKRLKG